MRKNKAFSEDKMKRTLRIIALCMCALTLIFTVSCGQKAAETTQDLSQAQDPTIVGCWKDPVSTNVDYSDVWSFNADGTYSFYQVDKSGNVKNAIDGTYTISGESLTIVMAGHSLKYDTYKVTAEAITLTDHGTETVLSKYTGEIKK